MREYLIIMAVAIFVIGSTLAIKVTISLVTSFANKDCFLKKCANCLNLLAILTVTSGIGILFLQVADLLI